VQRCAQFLGGLALKRYGALPELAPLCGALQAFRAGAPELLAEAGWVFKMHMFLGMSIFLIFPFSRLVHVWSAPVWYLGRRGYQVVRSRRIGLTEQQPMSRTQTTLR